MIEKNIRLQPHHSRDLLVGRRSDGRRPKYQPPGHRDAPSPSRGGPPGGGDRGMTYSAPAPSPHRDPAPTRAPDFVTYSPTPTPEPTPSPHLGGADDGGWTRAFESPTNVTGDTPEERLEKEFLETGDIDVLSDLIGFDTAPKVDVKDIMGEVDDPGSMSYDPTIEQQKTILEDPRVDEGFKRYIRQVQQPKVSTDRTRLMQSFMDTSPKIDVKDAIGRGVFNVGLKKLGLGMLNPFLGLASLFTRGRTPRSAYDLAKNLKSNIRTPSNIIDKRTSAIDTKPDREGRVDMQPKEKPTAVAKDPITKGIETYTGKKQDSTDLMSLYKILLQNRTRLTPQGLNIFSLISRYLRKPFEGRSRDIG